MKSSNLFSGLVCILTVTLLAVAGMAPANVRADEWSGLPSSPAQQGGAPADPATNQQTQQMFASPDDAVKALRAAVAADDRTALGQIFGPDLQSLQTGDKVQDANNARHFAHAIEENCQLDKQSDNEVYIDVGTNDWPMPIPLKQNNGQWYFDTAAGKEEIINRHIGRDELTAIGVCRAYVKAQQQLAAMNGGVYAQKFKSSPGKKDGLYWPVAAGESPSPFGALVAEAHAEGYGGHKGSGPHAFHGYCFRILTAQGKAAPDGSKDYMSGGQLKNGFALVAYPENWNQSGVMTFIVNQDGKVYQRDLGEKTDRIAARMKDYNPDKNWTLVQDEGILDAVSSQ
ncbi:MAG TPA: DUF2950 domain-containing protein [Candidatus Acidoferrum sp.]|nr:DUF2950 domain-containing protein [Candidatus Acidoferrum sp.]